MAGSNASGGASFVKFWRKEHASLACWKLNIISMKNRDGRKALPLYHNVNLLTGAIEARLYANKELARAALMSQIVIFSKLIWPYGKISSSLSKRS